MSTEAETGSGTAAVQCADLHEEPKKTKRKEKHTGSCCGVLPRSLIRGSTLTVKLVYEAIFPSGDAMPTWASYILKLVGFFGRG